MKSGFILIDKEPGITSHDVVDKLREITKIKKIGHAGTLDPIATGLLILGVGKKATKKLSKLQKLDKEYVARIKLGAISDTFDKEGRIKEVKVEKIPTQKEIKKILKTFIGKINQTPPSFSAKKIKGKKACDLARKGIKPNTPLHLVRKGKNRIILCVAGKEQTLDHAKAAHVWVKQLKVKNHAIQK